MTIQESLIKIDTKVQLLKENPQEKILDILLSNLLLRQTGYNTGVISLSAITPPVSGADSVEELFLINSEILVESCNTIIISSEYPFDLQVNEDSILENIYQFSLVSDVDQPFSINVSNRSEENDIDLKYLVAAASPIGSSYVHT